MKKRIRIIIATLLAITIAFAVTGCFVKTEKVTVTVVGGTGGGEVDKGSSVTVTADVPSGKVFKEWTDGAGVVVSTDNPYTFTANEDVTLMANYLDRFTVTVEGGTGGGVYTKGTQATVTANTAPENKTFVNWTVDGTEVSKANPYTFTVTQNITVVANFDFIQYSVIVEGGTGGGVHNKGSQATVTANTAPEGKEFVNWTVGGTEVSKANPYTFTVTQNVAVVANFDFKKYAVTVQGGTVGGSANKTVAHGSEVELQATIPSGKFFVNWTINETEISNQPTYKYVVTGAVTIVANFRDPHVYTVTVTNGNGGGQFTEGSTAMQATVTADAAPENKVFANWTVGGTVVSTDNPYTFTVTGNITVVANYRNKAQYTVTVSGGTISGGSSKTFIEEGPSTAIVTATVPAGKQFKEWTIDGTAVSTRNPYAFTVTKTATLTAVFRDEPVDNDYWFTASNADLTNARVDDRSNVDHGSPELNEQYKSYGGGFIVGGFSSAGKKIVWAFHSDIEADAAVSLRMASGGWVNNDTSPGLTFAKSQFKLSLNSAEIDYNNIEIPGIASQGFPRAYTQFTDYQVASAATLKLKPGINEFAIECVSGGGEPNIDCLKIKTEANLIWAPVMNYVENGMETPVIKTDWSDFLSRNVTVIDGSGGGTYRIGGLVTLTATVPEGEVFDRWEVGGITVSTSNPYTFRVAGDTEVTSFSRPAAVQYTVKVGNGTVNGKAEEVFTEGGPMTAVIIPTVPSGKYFEKWVDGTGADVWPYSNYTFTVTGDTELNAVFSDDVVIRDYWFAASNAELTNVRLDNHTSVDHGNPEDNENYKAYGGFIAGGFSTAGKKITWTLYSSVEADAVISLRMASGGWDTSDRSPGLTFAQSQFKLSLNSDEIAYNPITIPGVTSPGFPRAYTQYADYAVVTAVAIKLQPGVNVFTIECVAGGGEPSIDCLKISTAAELSWTPQANVAEHGNAPVINLPWNVFPEE